jgi:hypothetical protein
VLSATEVVVDIGPGVAVGVASAAVNGD